MSQCIHGVRHGRLPEADLLDLIIGPEAKALGSHLELQLDTAIFGTPEFDYADYFCRRIDDLSTVSLIHTEVEPF